jgi:hypothetical protein
MTCSHVFIAALFTVAKRWKQQKYLSADEWIMKIYVCKIKFCPVLKKGGTSLIFNNMDENGDRYVK